MKTSIRRAKSKDTLTIIRIFQQAHRENIQNGFFFPAYSVTKKQLYDRIKRDKYYVLVANKRYVGTIAVKKRKDYMEIGSLAILPAFRKKGFGLRLLRFAERKVRSMGWKRVVLFAPKGHPTLLSYYQKHGYDATKVKNIKNMAWIRYEKWLT